MMMTPIRRAVAAFVLLALPWAPFAYDFGSEIISDITTPVADEGRALKIKDEQFWSPVLQAANRAQDAPAHDALYAAAEAALAELGDEHAVVRQALAEAVTSLRRAETAVRVRGTDQAQLATEQLMAEPSGWDWSSTFSFLSGGRWGDLLRFTIRSFVDGGRYGDRLQRDIYRRRDESLPALRGASAAAGDVLRDCRKASTRAFDVLKYDIYTRGAPKTPKAAKDVADKIVAASRDTRRDFLGLVKEVAAGITKDVEAQNERPSATVTHSLFEGVGSPPLGVSVPGRFSASEDLLVAL
jgi:hypothetical protein